ncbi:MAG: hypothetical protein GEEBNDBF_02362 [bacterium]|nr:hypothetical protein [bacterium]
MRFAIALFSIATLLLSSGCGDSARSTPPPVHPTSESLDSGTAAGFFSTDRPAELQFGTDAAGQPTVSLVDRSGQFPVLSHVISVELLEAHYVRASQTWHLAIALVNHTPLTAYGAWVEFFDTEGFFIFNADGFATLNGGGDQIWWPGAGQIKPVVAFGKAEPLRPWYGGTALIGTLSIFTSDPNGSLKGLSAYVDVAYPGPREEPIVEDIALDPCAVTDEVGGCLSVISATVIDWQAPTTALPVFALVGEPGAEVPFPLVDDGTGADEVAGDQRYTGILPLDPRGAVEVIPVIAFDGTGKHFVNAVWVE